MAKVLAAVGLLVAVGLGGWVLHSRDQSGATPVAVAADQDPRLALATPYRNVRPEVKYVGDQVCSGCHPDKASTYRQHSMGRSMDLVARVAGRDDYSAAAHNPFEKLGFTFLVERRSGGVVHALLRRDAQGAEVFRQEREVRYVVGSGARGRAYLVERDGFLFQSPINWYSQARRWDLAPNATGRRPSGLFGPITPQCVFCHANRAEPIATTVNRYHTPLFAGGAAIGCERCHGPGELHVRRHEQGEVADAPDDTIVNPRNLEPPLRDAVCQQCHLQGEIRVERRGRQPFDYRPGLPLNQFWSVFVRPQGEANEQLVGQVEQLTRSRCFRASSGALGCISCHDPHVLPEPEERVAYYRGRCLNCHRDSSCRLPVGERQTKNGDSCIACHMPRINPPDVAHTAVSDHRIPRQPGRALRSGAGARRPLVPNLALANFYEGTADPPDGEVLRDLGVAVVEAAVPPRDRLSLRLAVLPLLEASLRVAPNDRRALEARGNCLGTLGRKEEALAVFEAVLQQAPEQETALREAANLAAALARPEVALGYWQRAIASNPWAPDYQFGMAKCQVARRDWGAAIAACQRALALDPTHLEARMLLVHCALASANRELARKEIQTLLALDVPQKESLRRALADPRLK